MAINYGKIIGSPNQNLILETAGHLYVKVAEHFYEIDFRNLLNGKITGTIVNTVQETEKETEQETVIEKEPIDLEDYITSDDLKYLLKRELKNYVTVMDWDAVKATQKALEDAMLNGFTESISPITVQTMQLTVGTDSLQFEEIKAFWDPQLVTSLISVGEDGELYFSPGVIRNYTLDGPESVQPGVEETRSDIDGAHYDDRLKYYWRWLVCMQGSYEYPDDLHKLDNVIPWETKEFTGYDVITEHENSIIFAKENDDAPGTYKYVNIEPLVLDSYESETYYIYIKVKVKPELNINVNNGWEFIEDENGTEIKDGKKGRYEKPYSNYPFNWSNLQNGNFGIEGDSIMAKTGIAKLVISPTAIKYHDDEDPDLDPNEYYLLYGIATYTENGWSWTSMNGFTEITPGVVRAYIFAGPNGHSYLDLKENRFRLSTSTNDDDALLLFWQETDQTTGKIKGHLRIAGDSEFRGSVYIGNYQKLIEPKYEVYPPSDPRAGEFVLEMVNGKPTKKPDLSTGCYQYDLAVLEKYNIDPKTVGCTTPVYVDAPTIELNADGSGSLAGDKIRWDKDGNLYFNYGVGETTIQDILSAFIINKGVDSVSGREKIISVGVKDEAGFYTDSWISTKGKNPADTEFTFTGIDEDDMWNLLRTPGPQVIDESHIPKIQFDITGGGSVGIDGIEELVNDAVNTAIENLHLDDKYLKLNGGGHVINGTISCENDIIAFYKP